MASSTRPPGTPDESDPSGASTPPPIPPAGWSSDDETADTLSWPAGAAAAGSTGASAATPPPRRGAARRAPVIVVLAAAMALLLGGGAFAFFTVDPFHLFRPGPQAAEGLPADAILYAGMDLDPTASQKVDALRFLNHFPAFRDSAGLTDENADVRETLVSKLLESTGCSDLDYADDVRPWLGQRFGFALMPPTPSDARPYAVAVQVTDEDRARDGIAALLACGSTDGAAGNDATGVAFSNGYLLLAQTQAEADGYASAADEHSLADDAEFDADVDSLGDAGVATMWVDVQAAVRDWADGADGAGPLADLEDLTSSSQRIAATFRFGSDHVEIATSVFGDTPAIDHGDNPIVNLPDSTVFALSESGGDQRVAQAWDRTIARARSESVDIDREISDFEASSGLSLPADLETVLGHSLTIALDREGLTAQALGGGDPTAVNLGVRFTSDPDRLSDIYDTLLGIVGSGVDQTMPFVRKDVDDGLIMATNQAYAEKLASDDGTLGDSDAFRSVVDDGADKEFVLFLDMDAVKDQVLQSMRDGGAPADLIANLEPLRSFGITAGVEGDYVNTTMRLSVTG